MFVILALALLILIICNALLIKMFNTTIFKFNWLHLIDILIALGAAILSIMGFEVIKYIRYRRGGLKHNKKALLTFFAMKKDYGKENDL